MLSWYLPYSIGHGELYSMVRRDLLNQFVPPRRRLRQTAAARQQNLAHLLD